MLLEKIFLVPARAASVWEGMAAGKDNTGLGVGAGWATPAAPAPAAVAITALAQASESGQSYHGQRLRQRGLSKVQGLRCRLLNLFGLLFPFLHPLLQEDLILRFGVWALRLRWQGKGSIHVFKCSRIGPSLITFQELVLRI